MFKMSKMKNLSILLFILILTVGCQKSAQALTLFEINTGKPDSASWQFTNEISMIWQQKYRDKESYFAPRYVPELYQRFVNLDKRDCRFIIAPLNAISELPITDLKIKIVAVLWEVYLAPIGFSDAKEEVGFFTHKNWYILEDSQILPYFLNTVRKRYNDPSTDLDSSIDEFTRRIVWADSNQIFDFGAEDDFVDPSADIELGFLIDQSSDISDISGDDEPFSDILTTYDQDIEEKRAPIDEEDIISILNLRRTQIKNKLESLNDDEVLFYEMLGRASNLIDEIGKNFQILNLEKDFQRRLLQLNPLAETFNFSSGSISTVSLTYALFVHEEEDIELVKELLDALYKPYRTYLSHSYLWSNLQLDETKEISPLFLHEGAIEFYNID